MSESLQSSQISQSELAQNLVLFWKENPDQFVRDMFGVTPEPWQTAALKTVNDHLRLTIRSGHGVGKSAMMSWLMLWYLMTRYPAKIAVTAPTSHQLFDVLWAEARQWINKMPEDLKSQFRIKADRIELADGVESFAVARTSRKDQPEALQGFHSENMLFLIDEASGVDDIIFEVAHGALSTKGARIVLTGNPTRPSGYFYNSHKPDSGWVRMKVPCSASSQVGPEFIEEMRELYGEDSNVYRVRVEGDFPDNSDNALLSLGLVEAAVNRDVQALPSLGIIWGVDVARFGDDDTVLVKRRGNEVLDDIKSWSSADTMETAGRIANEYNSSTISQRPQAVCVDVIGIGAGVVDRLKELNIPVRGVNVSEASAINPLANKLRDELWLSAKEWLERKDCKLPNNERLIAELVAPEMKFTSNGKLRLETKDELKKRGMKSPDFADAFVLTFGAGPGYAITGVDGARLSWGQNINEQINSDWII